MYFWYLDCRDLELIWKYFKSVIRFRSCSRNCVFYWKRFLCFRNCYSFYLHSFGFRKKIFYLFLMGLRQNTYFSRFNNHTMKMSKNDFQLVRSRYLALSWAHGGQQFSYFLSSLDVYDSSATYPNQTVYVSVGTIGIRSEIKDPAIFP